MNFPKLAPKAIIGNQQGFAIIEALIAAAVFSICMLSVVYTMVGAANANRLASEVAEATTLAADVIEQVSVIPYDDLAGSSLPWPDAGDGKYTFNIQIGTDAILDRTKSITVQVFWNDRYTDPGKPDSRKSVTIKDIKVDFI